MEYCEELPPGFSTDKSAGITASPFIKSHTLGFPTFQHKWTSSITFILSVHLRTIFTQFQAKRIPSPQTQLGLERQSCQMSWKIHRPCNSSFFNFWKNLSRSRSTERSTTKASHTTPLTSWQVFSRKRKRKRKFTEELSCKVASPSCGHGNHN